MKTNRFFSFLNIGGDDLDSYWRYKMPPLQTKIEGRGNGIKTVLLNIDSVAKHLHTEPSYITKYFGVQVGALSQYDRKRNVGIVHGVHRSNELQSILKIFIIQFILCPKCKLPELEYKVHQKKNVLLQKCASCGWKGVNSSNHKIKTYIINHPPQKKKKISKYIKEKTFLRGCINFKSIEDNFELLLYGYIRENAINNDLYNSTPLDIIYLILNICYNTKCKYFKQVKDELDTEEINEWNAYGKIFELDEDRNIIKLKSKCENPQIVFGKYVIGNKVIRKVWKIKVLKNYSENKTFTFKIGITQENSDKPITYELIANETVIDDDGFYYYSNIKEGDIISILFINYTTKSKKSDVLIQFAINEIIYPKQFDTMDMNLVYRGYNYKLRIKMSQKEELQLLQ